MKAHQIVFLLLKFLDLKSVRFSGKMGLNEKTLKMKVKVGNLTVLKRVKFDACFNTSIKNFPIKGLKLCKY